MTMTRITASAPTHAPALKMPPTTAHPGRKTAMTSSASSCSQAMRSLRAPTVQAGLPEPRDSAASRVVSLTNGTAEVGERHDSTVNGCYLRHVELQPLEVRPEVERLGRGRAGGRRRVRLSRRVPEVRLDQQLVLREVGNQHRV